ncbi:E3 ubiquitin-protein ligase RNF25 [Microplitis mediator]|uniref:E3 ubiquitin-protein ligase RNF25 n=1 Tax=Microplitis mediator TaxID=375433 RepID=UPI0025536218|nr:E3 ubiquitin-protein ligase RNF25 [Microplitis mediator]XP_057328637.1 E3 ubiquitin-protein ligase RNF25 [Microplitis mediator]XP_057328638.1 E3 ubiquitin-protein ligase RNF25 [Microplitis mediator]XP_057328639.1 E3 ubiquitin-protein ligase RNF25 [Microplitis mediator]XP_057328640.1 E3 ubiquitin-protein ligase RNF25 [Microplitis mediator]XP_057328641.1 E3 ubiquitin-protein ligase RNF25 [Microplitis mediator]
MVAHLEMSNDTIDERVSEEIEALCAILLDNEFKIQNNDRGVPDTIEILIVPSTGEDPQLQYVCVTLIVHLVAGYPDVPPEILLKNPRGLDEKTLQMIQSELEVKCQKFLGQPVMFELIELIREHLTQKNLPTGQCVICLYGFRDGDKFTKTECYHYFHSHCLAAHIIAAERYYKEELDKLPQWQQDSAKEFKALCPVCREAISCDIKILRLAPPPIDVETATSFSVSAELRDLQLKMSTLYLHQQQQGGIIDPEAEEIKMLLRTDSSFDEVQSSIPSAERNLSQLPLRNVVHTSSIADDHHILEQENTFQQASNQRNTLRTVLNHQHYYGRRAPRGHNRGNSNHRYGDRLKQSDSVPR